MTWLNGDRYWSSTGGWRTVGETSVQQRNAFKFVFKAYVGVVVLSTLTAMARAEPMTDPITIGGLSEEDQHKTRSLSCLLAQVLSGPPLQLMMNVGEQNGLEARRLLVRAEQPVTESILQNKFSSGFDKLEEELRTFEGLVKTYRAIFRAEILDSITQAVIKSQIPAEMRLDLELQTLTRTAELMSSLSKMRTASTESSAAAQYPEPMEIGWVKNKGQDKDKDKGKEKGKEKGKGK